jgi:hypothetical protein
MEIRDLRLARDIARAPCNLEYHLAKKLRDTPIHTTIFHPVFGQLVQDGIPQIITAHLMRDSAPPCMHGGP